MNDENYRPNALTPLYDAIGRTIRNLESKKGSKLVVIQTDGYENSSKEFSQKGIFDLISEKKKEGWTFAFLGADIDSWKIGQQLGLDRGNVMNYTGKESKKAFRVMASSTSSYVDSGGVQSKSFWNKESDELTSVT